MEFFTRLSCPLASSFWLDLVRRKNGKRLLRGRRCEEKVNVLFFLLFSYCLMASVLSGPTFQETWFVADGVQRYIVD